MSVTCERRRCRRERESERRAADRDNVTYCLIDELTGTREQWTVTANDVLSFARQVAVAMVTVQLRGAGRFSSVCRLVWFFDERHRFSFLKPLQFSKLTFASVDVVVLQRQLG